MKKALALVLSLVMAFSCLPAAFAVTFADEAKWPASAAWAKEEIAYMVEKGVLNGYAEDNTFRPADSVTRAQFIKMIDETFGLTATTAINYSDVTSDLWFHPYIAKAAAQGYLLNYGSALNPNGQLTRQEAAALLARYLDLDPTKKVASSTYTDYNSIKSAYREYVLQASYVGLFQGDEDGKFSPDRVLKRCEAAAILYRAAGTIYRTSATGTDSAAGDKNAVISKSGITVTGADIDGQLMITEGVSGGVVTLSDCKADTLFIRGTATVVLSGCTIDEVVVDSSAAVKLNCFDNCSIGNIVAKTALKLDLDDNCTVDSLTVEKDAANSSVSGSGTLAAVTVNAAGFKADKLPAKYTLGSGISATFNGQVYSGTGADAAAMGFSEKPSTYATSAATYLKANPAVTGQLYYYFTNTATPPTAANFNNAYTAASVKSWISVTANRTVDQNIGTTANVSSYNYVVVMISGYQPVVLTNAASNGFVNAPSVYSGNGLYDKINYTSSVDGTLYYYYTNSSNVPTTSTFSTTYNAGTTLYKGKLNVTANQYTTLDTVMSNGVSSYSYVVVLLMDAAGNQYQPLLITRGTSSTSTGFVTAPFCELDNTNVVLGLVSGISGTVEYYYATSAAVPTAEQFTANMLAAGSNISGSFGVTQNVAYYDNLPNQNVLKMHTHVVLRLTDASGTSYQPAVVAIPAGAGVDVNGSGFVKAPTTTVNTGYFYINAQLSQSGTLYYYLTDWPEAPAASAFDINYEAAVTGSQLASRNGGSIPVNAGTHSLRTDITNAAGSAFDYMVLMLKIGVQNMKPIVIPMTGGTTSVPTVSGSTGFLVDPVYTKTTERTHEISFTTSVNGAVYYYYTDDPTVPTDYKTVTETVATEISNNSPYAGTTGAVARYKISIPISALVYVPSYVVLMVQDETGLYYKPVIIPSDPSMSSAAASGFATAPTVTTSGGVANLNLNAVKAGTLYYYFVNSAITAPDSNTFMATYNFSIPATSGMTEMKGSFFLPIGSSSKAITVPSGYSYIVIMMVESGTQATYRQPMVLSLYGANGNTPTTGITGFTSAPYVYNNVLYINPAVTGTLYYYLTNDSSFNINSFGSGSMIPGVNSGTYNISQLGFQMVNLNSSGNSFVGSMIGSYANAIVWISTSTGITTDPVVVPMKDTGNSGTGTPTTTGFTSAPTYTMSLNIINFTPATTGTVKYFFTNSNSQYTAATFAGGYSGAQASGTIPVTASVRSNFTRVPGYKYVWLQLDSNAPVYIQLS